MLKHPIKNKKEHPYNQYTASTYTKITQLHKLMMTDRQMDKSTENNVSILPLNDFNINLFKQPPTPLSGLYQLVEEATRGTKSSATLTGHIYTNNKS